MQPTKPYLVRAIHEWCVDQGFTPYLAVAVDDTTRVPREFVKDGEIVLNVGIEATHQLNLGNEEITFQARFGGRPYPVAVPVGRVLAIYARENGQGMAFEVEEGGETGGTETVVGDIKEVDSTPEDTPPSPAPATPSGSPRPHLTRIK